MKNVFTFVAGGIIALAGVVLGTGLKPIVSKDSK